MKPPSLASALISVAIAAGLVALFTGVRALLHPLLGSHSPLMLYIVAVLIAGFTRGGLCGLIVLIFGGLVGESLFADPQGALLHLTAANLASLAVFWTVALLVLGMSLELARRANEILDRFTVDSRDEPPSVD